MLGKIDQDFLGEILIKKEFHALPRWRRHLLVSSLQQCHHLFPANTRKIIEEFVDGFTILKEIKQTFDWNPCASEYRGSAQDFRVGVDH